MPKPSQPIRSTTISLRTPVSVVRVRLTSGDLLSRTGPALGVARAAPVVLVELPLGAEDAQGAEELANGAVRMPARSAAGELARPALDAGEVVALGHAVRES